MKTPTAVSKFFCSSVSLFFCFSVFLFALASCAALAKMPVYPDDDPNAKLAFGELKARADDYYVVVGVPIYNYTQHDWWLDISCDWYNGGGSVVAGGRDDIVVKSGSKKELMLSSYYLWDQTPSLTVKCRIVDNKILTE